MGGGGGREIKKKKAIWELKSIHIHFTGGKFAIKVSIFTHFQIFQIPSNST